MDDLLKPYNLTASLAVISKVVIQVLLIHSRKQLFLWFNLCIWKEKESNTMLEDRKNPIGLSTDVLKIKHRNAKTMENDLLWLWIYSVYWTSVKWWNFFFFTQ